MKTMSILCNISPTSTLLSQFTPNGEKIRKEEQEKRVEKKKDWYFYIVAYFGKKRGLSKAQFLSHNFYKSRPMLKSIYENITLCY